MRTGCRRSRPNRERRRGSTRARDLPLDQQQSPLAAPGRRWRATDALPLSDAGSTCLRNRHFYPDPDVDLAGIRSGCRRCHRPARILRAERIRHIRARFQGRRSIRLRMTLRRTCRKRVAAGPSVLPVGRMPTSKLRRRMLPGLGLLSFSSLSLPEWLPQPSVPPA